jgi:hypothetical protein
VQPQVEDLRLLSFTDFVGRVGLRAGDLPSSKEDCRPGWTAT